MTKDELFLIKLYEIALTLGGPLVEVDRYKVGQAIGQNNRSVDNIVNILARTHFVKKGEGDAIHLTDHGKNLVDELIEK